MDRLTPGPHDVLLVVDVQNGFVPGGNLPVKGGDQIVPLVNRLARAFEHVVLTQDWHTPGHISFASSHPGKAPFETIELPYGTQVLWPDHCVQGTTDADLHPALSIPHAELIHSRPRSSNQSPSGHANAGPQLRGNAAEPDRRAEARSPVVPGQPHQPAALPVGGRHPAHRAIFMTGVMAYVSAPRRPRPRRRLLSLRAALSPR
jgi:hypothetical protein